MGQIKQTELDNGNISLEITYGGKEAPFGGVDTSAPPAYIDPRCFTQANNALVIDNKIVAVSLQEITTPTLWSDTANVILLTLGTFYNSITGQLNYVLGYTATPFAGPPSGVHYVFYITAWNPAFPADFWNDTLPITLFDAVSTQEQASITLDCIATQAIISSVSGSGATINITSVGPGRGGGDGIITAVIDSNGMGYGVGDFVQVIQGSNITGWIQVATINGGGGILTFSIGNPGNSYTVQNNVPLGTIESMSTCRLVVVSTSGTNTYSIPAWASGASRQVVVQDMVAEMVGNPDVTASISPDGYSVILTANLPGTGGNAFTVQDTSFNSVGTAPPPFYFSCRVARNLEGGATDNDSAAPLSFNTPTSTAVVGGTVYFANLGPMILKYSGPGLFTTSTLYNGVGTLRKFAGSLIGLRLESQLGVLTQNQDMIFAWSAAEDLDEWAIVSLSGLVTGAGFGELDDIADYLSGLVVSNGTAYIIRSNGISYATATGNATLPFAIVHVGLGDTGEGCQIPSLVCQYDQLGAFVGNTDIYQIAGQISSIGQKIKAAFFTDLLTNSQNSTCAICPLSIGGDIFPILVFYINSVFYVFNPGNGTWSNLNQTLPAFDNYLTNLGVLASSNADPINDDFVQTQAVFAYQGVTIGPPNTVAQPVFYKISEGIPNTNSVSTEISFTFPQEEISFGRDITIDGLYISLWADVTENIELGFLISGVNFSNYLLTPAVFNTLEGIPIEIQVFPVGGAENIGVKTGHSPQLTINIASISNMGNTAQVRFSKIAMFGSFEPNQRPV